MHNINRVLESDPLVKLIYNQVFVGWVYSIDYDQALVMTNDLWKVQAHGVPHNSFLVASSFNPDQFKDTPEVEREVILLRVVSSAKLPQDDDLIRTKIDSRQEQSDIYGQERDYDDITRNQLQFGGLKCRVLGTFYIKEGKLFLGSDLESFATANTLHVYRPREEALQTIVNYVNPLRLQSSVEEAKQLGLENPVKPFQIGTVRYTSTDRLHRASNEQKIPVCVQPADFLARRTAVLGMTRTGKSNMIKQMVSVVKRVADEGGITIGQIIYDINGEYANANRQDEGSIADIYPDETVRYRMLETKGFEDLRNNFYERPVEGFAVIKRELETVGRVTSDYIRQFVNISFDEPDRKEHREHGRWERNMAAYKVLLYKGGFTPPVGYKVRFDANKEVREKVKRDDKTDFPDPKNGLTLQEAYDWILAARKVNLTTPLPSSTAGKGWVDETLKNLMNMIAQKSDNDSFISGYAILADATKYHSRTRSAEVANEVYGYLSEGKIVILDLSVGDTQMREKISKQLAAKIFDESMKKFVDGQMPPNIVVYIEEAHNLIGKEHELHDTWPRLAKEGAKYRIALVYATQEVSSVHPNILANTENWFVTHLNNDREVRELSRFYDFEDFSRSIMRAQDVGFARVKTLSAPFVVPVQIDKFDPDAEKKRVEDMSRAKKKPEQTQMFR